MKKFSAFLGEEILLEKNTMIGSIDSEGKAVRHVINYVAPFMSAAGRKKTFANLKGHYFEGNKNVHTNNGEQYDSKAPSTHKLGVKFGEHEAGTPIHVSHVSLDGRQLLVHTKQHGIIPLSKIAKPESLKRAPTTTHGFDVEGKIAQNLGTKAAGSTGTAYDFSYKSERGHETRGHVRVVDEEQEKARKASEDLPDIRGESKLDKGKMGQSAFKWDKNKGWHFTKKELGEKFKEAKVNGVPLIEHFNNHHPNGIVDRSYSVDAPKGMTHHYLKTSNVNLLHIHHKQSDRGTTFSFGENNDLKGKTKLGHLGSNELEKLDGQLKISPTRIGSTQVIHRPVVKEMKRLAQLSSTDPKNHRDLTNAEHAAEFKKHVDLFTSSKKQQGE